MGLVLIAMFTLLSLFTDSRGQLTGVWIDWLDQAMGVGVWLFPVVVGILGVWVVIRAIERMPDLPWQKPVGFGLIFLAFIIGATLLLRPERAAAGGWLGAQLADLLVAGLGLWGAWAVVGLLTTAGVVLITDRLLIDGAQAAWLWMSDSWQDAQERRRQALIDPALPLPSGRLPWWKRLREGLRNGWSQPPPRTDLVRVDPIGPRLTTAQPQPQAQPVPRMPATPTSAARPEILTPRIVGGQDWRLPEVGDMLSDWDRRLDSDELIRRQGRLIQETLALFGVPADFEGAYKGPSVTQYLIKPGYVERNVKGEAKRIKVKVSKIAALTNDLALALAASSVRIEAPIPGTNYVGIEVPNQESNVVGLKELMDSDAFRSMKGRLRIALGEDVKGQPVVADLGRMPHLLIAGATGTGKSVCINSIVGCLLLTHTPDQLRLLMVDPKMVELSVYNGIPHLLSPVVTDVDKAAGVLFWAVKEMERRYQLFSKASARDLERYNIYLAKRNEAPLPYIVIIVDEMADLMMAAPEEVEKHICRLAQMARAVGMHLIIATQRPSVDVITGLIKANFPARIAFAVSSQVDSRVILDVPGAERLLGRGDMLYMASDASKLDRLQGTFLHDDEINSLVRYWRGLRGSEVYTASPLDNSGAAMPSPAAPSPAGQPTSPASLPSNAAAAPPALPAPASPPAQPLLFAEIDEMRAFDARDGLFDDAARIVREAGRGSVTLLQRKLRIGYGRAARLVEQLEAAGILGPDLGGGRGRDVIDGPAAATEPQPRIVGGEEASHPPPAVWM